MGHHINKKGFFQSDKHPELKENQIILNFRDFYAQVALKRYAEVTEDRELGDDILAGIKAVDEAGLTHIPD